MGERLCICGQPWDQAKHRGTMRREHRHVWRGHPTMIDPWSQWVRENLPTDHFVRCGDDGVMYSYRDNGSIVQAVLVEVKTHGRTLGTKDQQILDYVEMHALEPIAVLLDGNVPSRLNHYPVSHRPLADEHPAPEPVHVSTTVRVRSRLTNGVVSVAELVELLTVAAGHRLVTT